MISISLLKGSLPVRQVYSTTPADQTSILGLNLRTSAARSSEASPPGVVNEQAVPVGEAPHLKKCRSPATAPASSAAAPPATLNSCAWMCWALGMYLIFAFATSGAMIEGVPTTVFSGPSLTHLATPKSTSLTRLSKETLSPVTSTFSGFRSLWVTPLACTCARPSRTWRKTCLAMDSRMGPPRATYSANSRPCTASMTMSL
mmetsp:Transcript_41125/g.87605  ORF Transcript_41125/g.87605 Transcript_41125/m.87605 type:complete len:202 (-) Transcript_41125:417-1022(-)